LAEILIDSFQDVSKIIPILFLFILLTNWMTVRVNKGTPFFSRLARLDVAGGALLGIIPQCGISVAFAKLYGNGYISLGMLMAVFLAGSDEALIIIGTRPDKIFLMSGLLANTGFGILVVFRELPLNKTLLIILLLQAASILVGEMFYFTIG